MSKENIERQEKTKRLAHAIKSVMEIRGINSYQLAQRIGKSSNTVARWSNGETVMSMLDVKPFCEALGVTYDLIADPPPVPESPYERFLIENKTKA